MCKPLEDLYKQLTKAEPQRLEQLSGSGSNRKYYRVFGLPDCIGVTGTNLAENKAFFKLTERFKDRGIPVPTILGISDDQMSYLQEDLGTVSLFDAIAKGRETGHFSPDEIALLEKTISHLPEIQFIGAVGLNFNVCYPLAAFNRRTVMWDLNYFKYCFLKTSGLEFGENLLEDDFDTLADKLLEQDWNTFMYRDFQSRNVMIKDGEPFYIDYQGGRRGPIYYDVASFLWQAKANFPEELRTHLIQKYLESASRFYNIDETRFRDDLNHFVLFRLMQVLGAYGFRGKFERKSHFIESIPLALDNLKDLLDKTAFEEYPTLVKTLRLLIDAHKPVEKMEGLTVKITSFSYKKGIPEDNSGNGGGYVFDCRGMHNPGRYEEYKTLTGRDTEVIKFLEGRGEVQEFLKHCQALTDASVDVYLRRGFTSLSICFGCTGGQHRSVYCAEHLARHIANHYPVTVILTHREQSVKEVLQHG